MRISCPNCDAAYEVPETALAAGPRRLRCARCGHQFQAALPGAPPARPGPPPEPLRPRPAAPPPAAPATAPSGAPRLAEKMAGDRPAAPSPAPAPPMAAPVVPPSTPAARPRGPAEPAPTLPPIPDTRSAGRLRDAPASPPDRFAMAGWLLTIMVLGLAGYAAYAFRAEIVAAWPPALRVYALLGLG